ncbi:hypothetical protein K1I45_16175 [Geobacillus thermoleovorans]|nr:hypothetical protein [Geobacillus thermoleovorans]
MMTLNFMKRQQCEKKEPYGLGSFASLDWGLILIHFLRQVRYFGDGQPRSFRDFVNRQNVKQVFRDFDGFLFFGLFDRLLFFLF